MPVFVEYIKDGGVIMYPLMLCSFVAVFIVIERTLYFHRNYIKIDEIITGLQNCLKNNSMMEAVTLCDDTPGPVSKILQAAISVYDKDLEDIKDTVSACANIELPKLERRLNLLSTIAYITPLLGLLGTVLGMMGAFFVIKNTGSYGNLPDLSGKIGEALITTATGLCIAIPSYIAYNYFVQRVQIFAVEMERAADEILKFIKKQRDLKNVKKQEN